MLSAISARAILITLIGCGNRTPPLAKTIELPAAGSEKDDGNGLIAEASVMPGQISKPSSELSPLHDNKRGETKNANEITRKGVGRYAHYKFTPALPSSIEGSSVSPYAENYVVDNRVATGSIDGVVRWGRALSKTIRDLTRTRGKSRQATLIESCGTSVINIPRHTVVMIRSIERGRGFAQFEGYPTRTMQVGGVVGIGVCGISPFVQVVGPLGSTIRSHLLRPGPATLRDAHSAPQIKMSFDTQGDRRLGQVVKSGPVELLTDRNERGWLYVADHPFYVSIDEHGRFVMLDVPAGRYQLIAWHPPFVPGGAPLTTSRWVQVRVNKRVTTRLVFSTAPNIEIERP